MCQTIDPKGNGIKAILINDLTGLKRMLTGTDYADYNDEEKRKKGKKKE